MKARLIILFLAIGFYLSAQIPDKYYQSAYNKQGNSLKVAMHDIIEDHDVLSYDELWSAFKTTDKRPDNGKVWDIYSDVPDGKAAYYYSFGSNQCGNYKAEGDCYNREHSVPKNWFNDASPMYTDLFHLYPTDGKVNSMRSNYAFGEVSDATWTSTNGSKVGKCTVNGYSGMAFEPIDEYKGDLARTYFYFAVCYMNKNLGHSSYSMFNGGSLKNWAKAMLLRWSKNDPVSQKEIDRNNAIYEIQGNRNPFIDYPELVEMIFGSDTAKIFMQSGGGDTGGDDDTTGIEDWNDPMLWLVYPNPAVDRLVIIPQTSVNSEVSIQVLNLSGQIVFSEVRPADYQYVVDISSLASGAYVLRIRSDKFAIYKKVIVQ